MRPGFVPIALIIFIGTAILASAAFVVSKKLNTPSDIPPVERQISGGFKDLLNRNQQNLLPSTTPRPSPQSAPSASINSSKPASPSPATSTKTVTTTSDTTPPTLSGINGPYDWGSQGTCFTINGDQVKDNSQGSPLSFAWALDGNWSSFNQNEVIKCFQNLSGSHSISAKVKDPSGNISGETGKSFSVVADITVSVSGTIYRDINCSASFDGGEGTVSGVTVNIYKNPEYYSIGTISSDGSGNYSFSKTVKENEELSIQVSAVSPSGYKSNPHTFPSDIFLKSSARSATYNIPQVPNENVGSCF